MTAMRQVLGPDRRARRVALVRYVACVTALSLVWEFAQMPLYTLGQTGTAREIVTAGLHCAAGDAMIGGIALLGAIRLFRSRDWPAEAQGPVLVTALALGLVYTLFSEWLNVDVRGAWAYSELMPVLPVTGTGLAPVLQWLLIPPAAYGVTLLGRKRPAAPRTEPHIPG